MCLSPCEPAMIWHLVQGVILPSTFNRWDSLHADPHNPELRINWVLSTTASATLRCAGDSPSCHELQVLDRNLPPSGHNFFVASFTGVVEMDRTTGAI